MKSNFKVSIITVSLNSKHTIVDTIESVLNQSYDDIEYIIVDGGSSDGTADIINAYRNKISKFISEKDEGIYDALNKGIKLASGDIIGILNSDDFFYANDVVEQVVKEFMENDVDAVYGDVQFVSPAKDKIVRYYSSKKFN